MGWSLAVAALGPLPALSPHGLARTDLHQPCCHKHIRIQVQVVEIPACQDVASPRGPCPRYRSLLLQPYELWHATGPVVQYMSMDTFFVSCCFVQVIQLLTRVNCWKRKFIFWLTPLRLYLRWPGIHHGTWKDGDDGGIFIQESFLQDGLVLFHPNGKRHVVVLGPSSKRVQQQNWPLVPPWLQLAPDIIASGHYGAQICEN